MEHKPETTFGNVKADVIADKEPHFRRGNFCSVIRSSAWSGQGFRKGFRMGASEKTVHRCHWAEGDPLLRAYHDDEWGVPEYDSRMLWETLMLDGFQAGLSWLTILRKRGEFRKAFKNFDPQKIARFGEADIARLLANPGIIRSRAKIEATIGGARAYLAMREAGEDFSGFIWNMVGGVAVQNGGPIPAKTPLSEDISKALKKRGFKFVGPIIAYAWMQAVGLVNDHAKDCFRWKTVRAL
jgi:DNA-3-methyladenine glycosylase I